MRRLCFQELQCSTKVCAIGLKHFRRTPLWKECCIRPVALLTNQLSEQVMIQRYRFARPVSSTEMTSEPHATKITRIFAQHWMSCKFFNEMCLAWWITSQRHKTTHDNCGNWLMLLFIVFGWIAHATAFDQCTIATQECHSFSPRLIV
jgi:hypothetical protein